MRNKLLQLVHIGKTQLGMDDETYRSLLSQEFYQNSAKNISYSGLIKLVKLLQSKGAKIQFPRNKSTLSPLQRKVWAVWKSTADNPTSQALNAYVARIGVDEPWNMMNNSQASFVLETLKKWQERKGN